MEKSSSREKSKKLSFSPMKGMKYKTFLSSFLSPSSEKRNARRKFARPQLDADCTLPNKSAQQENDSIYSSIEEIRSLPHRSSRRSSTETDSITATPRQVGTGEDRKEPVYATVHKPPQKPKRRVFMNEADTVTVQKTEEENRILLQKTQELSEENNQLRKKLKELQKQEELKEANLHAKLQLEITQLEAETRREVGSLCERIGLLSEEKSLLNDQLEQVQVEKRELLERCNALLEASRTKVDSEFHAKTVAEHRRLLEESRERHHSEVKKYKEEKETLCETQKRLESSIKELRSNVASAEAKIKSMEESIKESKEESSNLRGQLEESRQIEEEHQKLLLSLLKVTETLAVERDLLLNKTSFQEGQQKELHLSLARYGLNIGRLQEHITNLSKENVQELVKLHSSQTFTENIHEYYTDQLDILREKILNQNDTITKMESEKRQLETKLHDQWETQYR